MKLPAWLVVVLVSALAISIWIAQEGWARAREAKGREEAAQLQAAGFQLAAAASKRDLTAAAKKVAALEADRARLLAQNIHSTPVVVVTGTTGPLGGTGPAHVPNHAAQAPAPGSPPPGAGPACLFAAGDTGEIRVSGGAVRTEAGNVVITGQADAYGLSPERHLFGGPLTLDAQYAGKPLHSGRGPGWGAGATVVATRDGLAYGPAIAAPPLRALGLQLDLSAAFAAGHESWAATATAVIRRSP